MKTISEIIGEVQLLLPLEYKIRDSLGCNLIALTPTKLNPIHNLTLSA